MATEYAVILDAFYHRVERDNSFFNYYNLDAEEAMGIAKQRALAYMDEALARISLECQPSIDLSNRDDVAERFNIDLSKNEIFLISSLMYQSHMEREIAYLKTLNVDYTSTDLRVFDPSNARSTYMDMYKFVCEQNDSLMDKYKSIDRDTGALKMINFSAYDTNV